MASDNLCLENIDEFVHDENKVVTCKWLSLTLKIHINQAKRLLYTFLQQQRKKDKEINVTYFLAGLKKGDNGEVEHLCQVVAEEDLAAAKSLLSAVTSCHVYSIQRANLKDSNVLYMTDYEGVKENLSECNKYSSIHCEKASKPRALPAKAKISPEKTRKGSNEPQRENGSSADKPNTTPAVSSKGKKAEPKGSIASMFAQSSKKTDTDAGKRKEVSAKEEAKENKPVHKKGGVMDMFANAKPAVKSKPAEVEKEKPVPKEQFPKTVAKDTKASNKKTSKVQESKSKKKPRPSEDSDGDEQPEKKRRRRIKNDLFDSSSEEETIEIEPDSPIPSPVREQTPEPESPKPAERTPEKQEAERSEAANDRPANGGKLRRRKRKLVPKTYLDEDGFMVTEKVWESDSTDASEIEEETKKKAAPQKKPEPAPAKKASPQKKASPAKGKQSSIMSFFKKK